MAIPPATGQLHLPHKKQQIICGHSICHLAITSVNTRVAIYCGGTNICHSKMAIMSATHKIRGKHLPLGNNMCHNFKMAYHICQAITSAIDTKRHNICPITKTENKYQYYEEKYFPIHHFGVTKLCM